MINIGGSVHRSFVFPADTQTAFRYYANMRHTLNMIPHISIHEHWDEHKYRMLYSTTELGIYRVRIFCNIQTQLDQDRGVMHVYPLEEGTVIKSKVGVYSLSAQGEYSSTSTFYEIDAGKTEIDYRLNLHAQLPIPLGLRLMPSRLLNEIAQSITQWRIEEIANGFIERSMSAFTRSS